MGKASLSNAVTSTEVPRKVEGGELSCCAREDISKRKRLQKEPGKHVLEAQK